MNIAESERAPQVPPAPLPPASTGAAASASTSATPPVNGAGAAGQGTRAGAFARLLGWAALLLAALGCVLAVVVWQRNEKLVREAARRWQDAEQRVAQLETQLKAAQDQARDLASRSLLLDGKVGEVVGQQAQLERMYRNIAQNSLDVVLADVENSISIAAQQLLVGSNVAGALLALQDADSMLRRVDQGSVSVLRKLVARDIERLKALPTVDISSMAARLDAVASGIDQLPMLAGSPVAQGNTAASDKPQSGPMGRITESGLRGWNSLTQELLALLRVTRVDTPDALLLAPNQQYFVRENLRLTLLSARLALLSRNETVFRGDLDRAIKWLSEYYDRDSRAVVTAGNSLKQLQGSKVSLELPSLAESISAVRAQRSAREGRP